MDCSNTCYLHHHHHPSHPPQHYEVSGTARREVPRMLYERGQIPELQNYILERNDRDLFRW